MDRRTSLLVIDPETDDDLITAAADATRSTEGHLSCLLLGSPPPLPYYAYGVPPYGAMSFPEDWREQLEQTRTEIRERVDAVEKLLAAIGTSGSVRSVICASVDITYNVARHACLSDLAYIAPNLRESTEVFRNAAHGVLFHSPIGLILNGRPAEERARIFVAWDTSETAASAVHAALPDLRAAQEVTIGCFDPVMREERCGEDPGADLAAWLSHHGCRVTLNQYPSGGHEIGRAIHDRAVDLGADLVVMGAYGHSRMKEAMFGGTTRILMEQTDLAVLMAH